MATRTPSTVAVTPAPGIGGEVVGVIDWEAEFLRVVEYCLTESVLGASLH